MLPVVSGSKSQLGPEVELGLHALRLGGINRDVLFQISSLALCSQGTRLVKEWLTRSLRTISSSNQSESVPALLTLGAYPCHLALAQYGPPLPPPGSYSLQPHSSSLSLSFKFAKWGYTVMPSGECSREREHPVLEC